MLTVKLPGRQSQTARRGAGTPPLAAVPALAVALVCALAILLVGPGAGRPMALAQGDPTPWPAAAEGLIQGDDGVWYYPCGACPAGPDDDPLATPPDAPADVPPLPPGFVSILVDTDKLTLTVYSDEVVWHQFRIAVGKNTTPTPLGEWTIRRKAIWGGGFGSRWMHLSIPWATYGIHGTNKPGSIGSRASGGCIRMRNRDAETLYRWVRVGTPVKAVGRPRGHFGEVPRPMHRSSIGSDVMRLQAALKDLGLYRGRIDGRFGWGTERAVREYQWVQLMPVTGVAGPETRGRLGLP